MANNLIDSSYFNNDINLPGKVLSGDYEVITQYIAKYEQEVLLMLLGYSLYKEFKAEIDAGTFSAKWLAFKDGAEYTVNFGSTDHTIKWNGLVNSDKTSLIAYYIYYQYMRDNISLTTDIGEVYGTSENSERTNPGNKITYAYNKFVDLYGKLMDGVFVPSAYRYLYENESDFDLWVFTPVEKINNYGI